MRKIFVSLTAFLFALAVHAQNSDPETDYIKKTYSKDKKIIVGEYMNLAGQDSLKFWEVYENFEVSRKQITTKRFNLVLQYVNNYSTLTPDQIDQLVRASFDNNITQEKLNADFYGSMAKAIGAVNSAKWMQLEIYLQTMWKAVIQNNIPLIGALNQPKQ
jgi:hypothetical protein